MNTPVIPPAEQALANITTHARALADAMREEFTARVACDELLRQLTDSLVGNPNPLTGKEHSATSAEAAAKGLPEYRTARASVADCERTVLLAQAALDRAKLEARYHVALVANAGGAAPVVLRDTRGVEL